MRFVAFLRGVNVGKHNRVRMDDLRQAIVGTGLKGVSTYLQSGNVLLDGSDPNDVLSRVRRAIESLHLNAEVVLRSGVDMERVVATPPRVGSRST